MGNWMPELLRWVLIWVLLFLGLCAVSVIIYWEQFWGALRASVSSSFDSSMELICVVLGLAFMIFSFTRMMRR